MRKVTIILAKPRSPLLWQIAERYVRYEITTNKGTVSIPSGTSPLFLTPKGFIERPHLFYWGTSCLSCEASTVFHRWWTSLNVLDFERSDIACENSRFSSIAARSEEKRLFSQARSNKVCKTNDLFFSAVTPWYVPEPSVELTSPIVWEEQLASFVP